MKKNGVHLFELESIVPIVLLTGLFLLGLLLPTGINTMISDAARAILPQ